MTSDDADPPPAPAKKPGFLRRLFGGGAAGPVPDQPPEVDDDAPPASVAERVAPSVEMVLPPAETAAVPDGPPTAGERLDPDALPPAAAPSEPFLRDTGDTDPDAFALLLPEDPAPEPAAEPAPEPEPAAPPTWWARLRQGLARSSSSIGQGITDIFGKRKLDAATLEDLDDILIRADLGVATATRITDALKKNRFDKETDPDEVRAVLAAEVEAVLRPVAVPFVLPEGGPKPFVVLVVGVNGSGKTTTIGKLAAKLRAQGRAVTLAAGDTFRAAAVEQLKVWGARVGAPVVARDVGADAAGLAFDALAQARETGADVLLVDTAGRLQNRTELMDELAKVIRVMRKLDADAPHATLLVLDATVGQNALSQVEVFARVAGVTGLVMTKLDGTARGGILVAIAESFALPVHFIGVGEGVDDLEPFEARDFARAIAGLDGEGSR